MNAPQTQPVFDRTTEDVGNIVLLEHVNVTQQDQRLMTLFWVGALGGTRDPYLHVIDVNMWVNFGRQQIHSPSRPVQVLRGTIGLVLRATRSGSRRRRSEFWRGRRGGGRDFADRGQTRGPAPPVFFALD